TASGVPITWGAYHYELTKALQGRQRWEVLDRMEADSHVKGTMRDNTLPLLTAKWDVKAASSSARDTDAAEFVSANLLRAGGDTYGEDYYCQTSFIGQRLPEICDMLRAGYSMFAKSTRVVNRMRVYDRIQWLEPASVDPHGWVLGEDDSIQEILRTYRTPGLQYNLRDPLPLEKIALYVWDLKGARFEGRPYVRSMYGPWYRKEFIMRMAMLRTQKVGSPVPWATIPNNYDANEKARAEEFLEAMRGTAPDESFGLFRRTAANIGPDFRYMEAQNAEADLFRGLIDGENLEIAHAGG